MRILKTNLLVKLFKLCKDYTRCVLLNACYSANHAKAICKHIDYAIGMRDEIGDELAIKFALAFYDALSTGRSVDDSFEFGLTSIPNASEIPIIAKNPNASSTTLANHSDDDNTIPFIIVAITKTEAEELFKKHYKKELKQLIKSISKGRDTTHFISQLINRYASKRNEWKPFDKDDRTMEMIIEGLFPQLAELDPDSKKKSFNPWHSRAACRNYVYPAFRDLHLGFRLVKSF